MKYIVADFTIDTAPSLMQIARELLADLAATAGFEAFEDTDGGLKAYAQAQTLDKETLDGLLTAFPLEQTTVTYQLADVEDRDWNETWEQAGFAPIVIGNSMLVYDAKQPVPSPDDYPAMAAQPLLIAIEAVQAFGSGTHQTTQMMLSALRQEEVARSRVLDCGCGTGILGIAAAMLGAATVTGFDIDEWSVDNSRHNAALNHVDNLEVLHGDVRVLEATDAAFDIVMANINRNILLNDLPAYARHTRQGGTLLLSGFYEQDAPLLIEAAAPLGFGLANRLTADGWCCLKLRKNG